MAHGAAELLARTTGAALLGTTAGIHAYLYVTGYRTIAGIGPLFGLLVVGTSLLCLAILAVPRRALAPVAAVGALTEAAAVVGLVVTEQRGLFGFRESSAAPLFWPSLYVEIAGTLVLLALLVGHRRRAPAAAYAGR